MNIDNFISEFENSNDSDRWRLVKDNQDLGIKVMIDNDDVSVYFDEDDEKFVQFDEFGYTALNILLSEIGIKSDFV